MTLNALSKEIFEAKTREAKAWKSLAEWRIWREERYQ